MKNYIGVKRIKAELMSEIAFINKIKNEDVPQNQEDRLGYLVEYPDGYKSWSPKDVFEEAYRETTGLTFGLALEALKKGLKVARDGWNGKDMWLSYCNGRRTYIAEMVIGTPAKKKFSEENPGVDHVLPFIVMKTVTGQLVPWLASQTDMLSDDWQIVE